MITIGVDCSLAAGVNWKNGLTNLSQLIDTKLDFQESYHHHYFQKVSQYLKGEPGLERMKNYQDVLSFNAHIYSHLLEHGREQRLTLGGDHAIAMATIEASLALLADGEKMNIIWIDAHGDYNDPETSPSSNIHGVPLYYLLNCSSFRRRIHKVFLWGTTALDPGEKALIANDDKVYHTPLSELGGVDEMLNLFQRLGKGHKTHLSFDIDALTLQDAPGTGCQIEEGISWNWMEDFFTKFFSRDISWSGVDIVEFNPDLDIEEKTLSRVRDLVSIVQGEDFKKRPSFLHGVKKSSRQEKSHLQKH